MNVRDLIEKLQQFDRQDKVMCYEFGEYLDDFELVDVLQDKPGTVDLLLKKI
jgi:hypothetical protein